MSWVDIITGGEDSYLVGSRLEFIDFGNFLLEE